MKHTITISKGKVTVAVEGVKGSACQDATRALEERLGTRTNDTLTDEYYQHEETQILNQQ